MKTLSWSAGIALLAIAVCVAPANAATDPAIIAKCEGAIAKATSQFVQARVKALSKCEQAVVKAGTGSCPDDKAQSAIDKAGTKLASAIGKSCGGADKVCGDDLINEPTRAELGWPAECPHFERNGCRNVINDTNCKGLTQCLQCIGGAAADQAIALYSDELVTPTISDKVLNKCQLTINKAASAFLNAKSKALQKCWDGKLKGKHTGECFGGDAGDGKYLAAITKAETKMSTTICKACGGANKACGTGGDDLTPAQIGFRAECPPVIVPNGGDACGATITDLQSIVDCVGCVTEYKADCVDALAVPQFEPYPSECADICAAPAASGPCPTSFEFTADGLKTELDAGFTGLGHNANVPTNGRITLAVSGCSGVAEPTCGTCNVAGPLPNAGGVTFNSHRCQGNSWVQCTSDSDCTNAMNCSGGANNQALCTTASECPGGSCVNAGYTGPCIFYFGSPLPLVAGGVPTCILNEIDGPVTGTANLEDGTSLTSVPLISKVHPIGTVFQPCPNCVAGICDDGLRQDLKCTVNGESNFGDVSLDCPPNPNTLAGSLQINLKIATGTQTVTVSTANAPCRDDGAIGLNCLCDTCNNINQEGCMTNADCPMSGGNPGICGGKRCIGGTNDGAPCTNNTACPSGLCNWPGEATKPNSCQDDTSTAGLDCVPALDLGPNEGRCSIGPIDKHCSIQTSVSCSTTADCQPGPPMSNCPAEKCVPFQTCVAETRKCYTDNGELGATLNVDGNPDPPCGDTSRPTVGTFFCVAPVAQGSVNAASGLPGLGRVRIPGTVVITP